MQQHSTHSNDEKNSCDRSQNGRASKQKKISVTLLQFCERSKRPHFCLVTRVQSLKANFRLGSRCSDRSLATNCKEASKRDAENSYDCEPIESSPVLSTFLISNNYFYQTPTMKVIPERSSFLVWMSKSATMLEKIFEMPVDDKSVPSSEHQQHEPPKPKDLLHMDDSTHSSSQASVPDLELLDDAEYAREVSEIF